MKNRLFLLFVFLFCSISPLIVSAHSGGTDARGGHHNSRTGGYHYHHGYSAHGHYDIDGDGKIDCPNLVKKENATKSISYEEPKEDPMETVLFWISAVIFIGLLIFIIYKIK